MKKQSGPEGSQPEESDVIDGGSVEIVEIPEKKSTQPVRDSRPGNFDIQALLSQAISQGNVEIAERVLVMHDKLKAAWAKEQFDKAMSKFQGECPVIEKTRKVYEKDGRTLRYKFAPLDSIVAQTKKPIAKNGLSYTIKTTNGDKSLTSTVRVTHIAGHSEENSFTVPIGEEQYMSQVQKYGARSTFAKRYAYCDAFGIMTGDEDNDAVEEKEQVRQPAKPEQRPAPKQQQAPNLIKTPLLNQVKIKLNKMGAVNEQEALQLLHDITGLKWLDMKASEKQAEIVLGIMKKKEDEEKQPKYPETTVIDESINDDSLVGKVAEEETDNEKKARFPFSKGKISVLIGLVKSKKGLKDDKEVVRYINSCTKVNPSFPRHLISSLEDLNTDEGDKLIKYMMTMHSDETNGQ